MRISCYCLVISSKPTLWFLFKIKSTIFHFSFVFSGSLVLFYMCFYPFLVVIVLRDYDFTPFLTEFEAQTLYLWYAPVCQLSITQHLAWTWIMSVFLFFSRREERGWYLQTAFHQMKLTEGSRLRTHSCPPIILLITCNIVAGDLCQAESDWWALRWDITSARQIDQTTKHTNY